MNRGLIEARDRGCGCRCIAPLPRFMNRGLIEARLRTSRRPLPPDFPDS